MYFRLLKLLLKHDTDWMLFSRTILIISIINVNYNFAFIPFITIFICAAAKELSGKFLLYLGPTAHFHEWWCMIKNKPFLFVKWSVIRDSYFQANCILLAFLTLSIDIKCLSSKFLFLVFLNWGNFDSSVWLFSWLPSELKLNSLWLLVN